MSDEHPNEPDPRSPAQNNNARRGDFSTTRWTLVITAGRISDPAAKLAMEELCQTYWFPLYAYVRRRGYSKEDAEDLTQDFFAGFLQKNNLGNLNPEHGRFRAYLLAAMKNFLANNWDKSQRKKRGGGMVMVSLDLANAESRYRIDPADHLSPDKLYDRAWAVTLLERVIEKLEAANPDDKSFAELKPCLTAGKAAINYSEVAARLNTSEGSVRVAVHRLRRQYRDLLRAEIASTLTDPAQIANELQTLTTAFSP